VRLRPWIELAAVLMLALAGIRSAAAANAAALYARHCASCHGAERLGGSGPALLPENLGRITGARAGAVIAEGRPATQMPSFQGQLRQDEIDALAAYVSAPLAKVPEWSASDIAASRIVHAEVRALERPIHDADPLNLFVVVESGDHHATILDGDRFEPLVRFPTRFALHGGPKFSPDGRFVYFMSRDGWITKYDLWALETLAEVRAGINSRNIAMSNDGRHLAVANYLPGTIVILSTLDLAVEKVFATNDSDGNHSRVSAIYQAPARHSFVAALKDVPELWEIGGDTHAGIRADPVSAPDSAADAGEPALPRFGVRRIALPEPLDDFFFDPAYRHLIGSARGGPAVVVDLDAGRPIQRLDLPGLPHLGSGIAWELDGRLVLATPHLEQRGISVIDMRDWSVVTTIDACGPGFFLRSHEATPYAWADCMLGPNKDTLTILDKQTLQVVRTLTPAPGRTAAHVEFDRTGRHALVSIWEAEGELVVYDAETFAEVKRMPMARPSGKYNVWNKITFSIGTSH
jgi:dihydro-heme d1 dehydrogenase